MNRCQVQVLVRALAIVAIIFGLMTVASGAMALFGDQDIRTRLGSVVPLVLWFNFLGGFVYVAAGIGILLRRRWGSRLAVVLAIATLLVFAIFGIHVAAGGAYEMRTVAAMTLRSAFWIMVAIVAMRAFETGRP